MNTPGPLAWRGPLQAAGSETLPARTLHRPARSGGAPARLLVRSRPPARDRGRPRGMAPRSCRRWPTTGEPRSTVGSKKSSATPRRCRISDHGAHRRGGKRRTRAGARAPVPDAVRAGAGLSCDLGRGRLGALERWDRVGGRPGRGAPARGRADARLRLEALRPCEERLRLAFHDQRRPDYGRLGEPCPGARF